MGDYDQKLGDRYTSFYLANLELNLFAHKLNATAQNIYMNAADKNDVHLKNILSAMRLYR